MIAEEDWESDLATVNCATCDHCRVEGDHHRCAEAPPRFFQGAWYQSRVSALCCCSYKGDWYLVPVACTRWSTSIGANRRLMAVVDSPSINTLTDWAIV